MLNINHLSPLAVQYGPSIALAPGDLWILLWWCFRLAMERNSVAKGSTLLAHARGVTSHISCLALLNMECSTSVAINTLLDRFYHSPACPGRGTVLLDALSFSVDKSNQGCSHSPDHRFSRSLHKHTKYKLHPVLTAYRGRLGSLCRCRSWSHCGWTGFRISRTSKFLRVPVQKKLALAQAHCRGQHEQSSYKLLSRRRAGFTYKPNKVIGG